MNNNEIMPNFLLKRAFLTPDRTAIYFQDQKLTFQELYECAVRAAGQLQGMGVKNGQYIGVLLRNHPDTVVLLFSLQLLGARAVILNNLLTSSELAWQLDDSKAAFLITETTFSDKVNQLEERIPTVTIVTKEELESAGQEIPDIKEEISLADICTIMYTSGTTGSPKGVIHTFGNHWWSAVGSALNLGYMEGDCWLCSVPLFHISGYSILMKSVIYGMPVVLHDKFHVEKTFEAIRDKHITIMSVVGTMLTRLVDALGDERLPHYFRCMLLGGGPAPLPLLQACVDKKIPVYQSYGMTETSSQIVTLSPEYSLTRLGSAGKPLFPAQLQVLLEDGTHALPNIEGEIVVKGPNVTSGYLNRPEATKERIRDGWLYTGDIGRLDEEGFLYVLDRRSDLIISGGENIYPAELEAVLLAHPDVADAGVAGMEDANWGQVPIAFVVPKENRDLQEKDLREFCLSHLAKYKVPKGFRFVGELPRNASKKLLRRELRKWVKDGIES